MSCETACSNWRGWIELVSWTASNERTYECSGEVCGTGNERRPGNVLVPVKLKSIDICGRIAPRRNEPRAGDSHHSTESAPSSAGRCLTQDKVSFPRPHENQPDLTLCPVKPVPFAPPRGRSSLPPGYSVFRFLTGCLSCMWILITPVPSNVPGIVLYLPA
jgi:hypothetical protein